MAPTSPHDPRQGRQRLRQARAPTWHAQLRGDGLQFALDAADGLVVDGQRVAQQRLGVGHLRAKVGGREECWSGAEDGTRLIGDTLAGQVRQLVVPTAGELYLQQACGCAAAHLQPAAALHGAHSSAAKTDGRASQQGKLDCALPCCPAAPGRR